LGRLAAVLTVAYASGVTGGPSSRLGHVTRFTRRHGLYIPENRVAGVARPRRTARGEWSARAARDTLDKDKTQTEEDALAAEVERERIRRERELVFEQTPGAIVEWSAVSGVNKAIEFNGLEGRSPEAYLALPPENYSVLSSKTISRTDPGQFKATFGPLNFFGNRVMVEMLSSVKVDSVNKTATIEVYDCNLSGSPAADAAKGTFQTKCHTRLTCFQRDGVWKFRGDYDLRVRVKPQAYGFKAKWRMGILRRVGNAILRPSVKIAMRQFLEFLAKDYHQWASGANDKREAVTESEIGVT